MGWVIEDSLRIKKGNGVHYFAHVNHQKTNPRIGKLLCINGAGIAYQWLKETCGIDHFRHLNDQAEKIPIGSDGLLSFTFGNGAERIFNNNHLGASIKHLNYTRHGLGHLARATIEGIAFAFVYGFELLGQGITDTKTLKAGNDNLFQSSIFSETLSTLIQYPIEIIKTTGATGAARASYLSLEELHLIKKAVDNHQLMTYHPNPRKYEQYHKAYHRWKKDLLGQINQCI